MSEIKFDLSEPIIIALAISRGWSPVIEDTDQPLEGDEYPKIPNPITAIDFVQQIAPEFIISHVRVAARESLLMQFKSTFLSIEDKVKSGTFDTMLLQGDVEGIFAAVRQSL